MAKSYLNPEVKETIENKLGRDIPKVDTPEYDEFLFELRSSDNPEHNELADEIETAIIFKGLGDPADRQLATERWKGRLRRAFELVFYRREEDGGRVVSKMKVIFASLVVILTGFTAAFFSDQGHVIEQGLPLASELTAVPSPEATAELDPQVGFRFTIPTIESFDTVSAPETPAAESTPVVTAAPALAPAPLSTTAQSPNPQPTPPPSPAPLVAGQIVGQQRNLSGLVHANSRPLGLASSQREIRSGLSSGETPALPGLVSRTSQGSGLRGQAINTSGLSSAGYETSGLSAEQFENTDGLQADSQQGLQPASLFANSSSAETLNMQSGGSGRTPTQLFASNPRQEVDEAEGANLSPTPTSPASSPALSIEAQATEDPFLAALAAARQSQQVPQEHITYAAGKRLNATLSFGFLTTDGSQLPILIQDENGTLWRGKGRLNDLARVEIELDERFEDGSFVSDYAIVLGLDNYPGVKATVREEAPAIAADIVQATLRGVTDFVAELADNQTLSQTGDTVVVSDQTVPLEWAIAGSITELFVPERSTRSVIRVAELEIDTPVQIIILGL